MTKEFDCFGRFYLDVLKNVWFIFRNIYIRHEGFVFHYKKIKYLRIHQSLEKIKNEFNPSSPYQNYSNLEKLYLPYIENIHNIFNTVWSLKLTTLAITLISGKINKKMWNLQNFLKLKRLDLCFCSFSIFHDILNLFSYILFPELKHLCIKCVVGGDYYPIKMNWKNIPNLQDLGTCKTKLYMDDFKWEQIHYIHISKFLWMNIVQFKNEKRILKNLKILYLNKCKKLNDSFFDGNHLKFTNLRLLHISENNKIT